MGGTFLSESVQGVHHTFLNVWVKGFAGDGWSQNLLLDDSEDFCLFLLMYFVEQIFDGVAEEVCSCIDGFDSLPVFGVRVMAVLRMGNLVPQLLQLAEVFLVFSGV